MSAALLAWSERPEPGSTALSVMLGAQSWWSACLFFQVEATALAAKLFWVRISWIGVVVIPVAWLVFAMEYTGRDHYVRLRNVVIISVVPAITVLLAFTGSFHDYMYVESELVERNGSLVLQQTGGVWFWVAAGYTYLLGLLGSIPLLGLVTSDALPFRRQSVALLLGTLAPWASNALYLVGVIPTHGLDPTPVAFAVTGVAYLGALTRFNLLGTNPSPIHRAGRFVFERLQDGAVVVDGNDFVVDLNDSAAETLEMVPARTLGYAAEDVVPGYASFPEEGSSTGAITIDTDAGSRPYDVTVTRITDHQERCIGRVIVFHDISEHVRQQQRLEVLNRVLRHNIRTETNLITGYADLMSGDEEHADIVKRHATNITEIGEKAREITNLFEHRDQSAETVSLRTLLDSAVESVRAEFPGVTIHTAPVPEGLTVDRVLGPVLSNVVENAAEHNTREEPSVWISVECEEGHVEVVVRDNGPGIDEYERSVLERGTETPLMHGSGLGLWLITWGAGIAGGEVVFESNEPTGSIVTVRVPNRSGGGESAAEPLETRQRVRSHNSISQ